MKRFKVLPSAKALAYYKNKIPALKTDEFNKADGALHDYAFTVAGVEKLATIKSLQASLNAALLAGQPFAEWKAKAAAALQKEIGKKATAQMVSRGRLQTIYRNAFATSYAAGRWQQIKQDADVYPYLRYSTVGDNRVRDEHAALEGITRRATDEIWNSIYPPNGHNCRCDVEQLAAEELKTKSARLTPAAALKGKLRRGGADAGWARAPGKNWRGLAAQTVASALVRSAGGYALAPAQQRARWRAALAQAGAPAATQEGIKKDLRAFVSAALQTNSGRAARAAAKKFVPLHGKAESRAFVSFFDSDIRRIARQMGESNITPKRVEEYIRLFFSETAQTAPTKASALALRWQTKHGAFAYNAAAKKWNWRAR